MTRQENVVKVEQRILPPCTRIQPIALYTVGTRRASVHVEGSVCFDWEQVLIRSLSFLLVQCGPHLGTAVYK